MEPRITWLEIDLTYSCGLGCHNCNRMTQLLPGTAAERVSVEQIEWLISESLRLNYPWEHWWLVGGEPTTHPRLMEICRLISKYRDIRGTDVFSIGMATHGYGEHTNMVVRRIQHEFPHIKILNSKKSGPVNEHFVAVCLAPVDYGDTGPYHGCGVSWHCGIALNYRGFYPCAIAAAIDRIFNLNAFVTKLEEVTISRMKELWNVYCGLCGYHGRQRTCGNRTLVSRTWYYVLNERRINCEQIELIEG